jgi:hypothetical protein
MTRKLIRLVFSMLDDAHTGHGEAVHSDCFPRSCSNKLGVVNTKQPDDQIHVAQII